MKNTALLLLLLTAAGQSLSAVELQQAVDLPDNMTVGIIHRQEVIREAKPFASSGGKKIVFDGEEADIYEIVLDRQKRRSVVDTITISKSIGVEYSANAPFQLFSAALSGQSLWFVYQKRGEVYLGQADISGPNPIRTRPPVLLGKGYDLRMKLSANQGKMHIELENRAKNTHRIFAENASGDIIELPTNKTTVP